MDSNWIYISGIFVSLSLVVWVYDPKMLVENDDGIVTYEDTEDGRPTIPERLRVIFAIVIIWAVVMAVDYREVIWPFARQFFSF